ncbi:hypothetical protein SCX11_09775 [Bifidobacterium longum]|uniref:hypothetical protein n=1 Tax=Bifidobacterium longum TaxID=216816 RepID=UPI00298DECCA|nr:hypothetical protein [Bifidobacterium longum]MDW7582570.1 hypothetical protein [Bifidobacterium longum]
MGRNNNPTRGSTIRHVVRTIAAGVAAAATLAAGMLVAGTADAADMRDPFERSIQNGNPGLWANVGTITFSNGHKYENTAQSLGVVDRVNGKNTYCIEADTLYTGTAGTWGEWTDERTKPDAQRLAWLTDRHNDDRDDLTQAAIAGLIHQKLDPRGNEYMSGVQRLGWADGTSWDTYTAKMNSLWNEAVANTPAGLNMEYQYTQGKRKGTINVGIQNGNGANIAGAQYTATLNGPAVFDQNGKNTISGTTTGSDQHLAWTATGNGEVTYTLSRKIPKAAILSSPNQNLMSPTDPGTQTSNITFQVRNNFQPTVSTQVSDKIVPKGARVSDKVTSGIKKGDEWVDGVNVTAKGYYYTLDARQANDLTVLKQDKNEKTADYLNRVAKKYGHPVATADATFGRAAQEQTVTAKNTNGTDYVNPQDGRIGTWVWVILKNEQTQPDHITADYVDPFGQTTESDVHKAAPNHDSTVLEQYTGLNKDIMDTITIGGLPQDYGQFNTNEDYGFGGDVKAKIRVWWAGSGTGDRTQDEKFKPTTQAEPTADANHRLLGEWEVPAGNGTYKVGGGKITFRQNNTGDAKIVVDRGVDIKATTNNESGYYVFIYDFPGSDRAAAFKSAYNDPWERSFVEETPHTVDLTSNVSTSEAGQGEEFYDVAHINGQVARGSYVTFTAYDAVPGSPNTAAPKKLDNYRVPVSNEQADASSKKAFDIISPKISTDTVGNVYWKVSLYNEQNELLASHALGIESETVKIIKPKITTQVTKSAVKPGEEFADKATITGKIGRGAYVTFDAYEPVPGDPDTNAGKLVDSARVNITDEQADKSGVADITVTSPKTKTDDAGAVYWKASLWSRNGALLATHDLGLPSETTFVQPGGIVTSNAQKLGATGEQLYDEITVYDETSAEESADGQVHEGKSNSNPHGVIGRIPQHSTVTVEMYRQSTEDNGDQGMYKIAEKTVPLDTNQMTPIKEGQSGNRPGKLTLKVTDPKFKTDKAGMIYWKTTLKTSNGAVLDSHIYGEWNSDHESGYKSYERTPVQKYSTTVSKKWMSDADGKYADSTLQVYDVLHQTGYEPYNDEYRVGNTAQTPDGATMQFEIWSKDGKNKGTMVKSYDATELPKLNRLGTGKEPDPAHPNAGDDTLDNYQNVKSATATIPSDWDASKYYYRVRVTVPTTTPGNGSDERDRNRDVVWYGGYDEDEAFDVIHVDTTTTEPLWVDGMNVSDEITLKGNIPAGMQYEAELWRTSKDGNVRKNAATKYDDTDHKGVASEKVATTGRQDVPKSALGAHLDGVTFRTKSVKSPGVGSYIWRVKLYSPEQPHDTKNGTGTGGDTSMPAQSGVITGAWMKQAGAAKYADDPQGGDHWSQANEKQTGVGDGYQDRWLLFDGCDVDSEKFEVIRIDTDVAGTNLIHTWKDEHYVDVTNNGADVNDHATISGYMLDGYKLGFELYKQASGTDASKDMKVNGVGPVSLKEAQKELDSAKLHITDPGDYYWVTVFTKPDGTAWQPDNVKESRSDKRVKAESFHAVRITTTTAKWTGKDNTTTDVALIEGCLPEDAVANFELHDYGTGDKVAETGDTTLKELGYKTCTDGNTSQSVESKPVTLPDAKDHYFVESVRFPNEDKDKGLHRGNDKVKSESTRTITANTDVNVETMLNIPVSDHTDLVNVKYSKNDGKDIRNDLTGPLTASWEVWKQNKGDDPSKDVKITTLADGKQAIQLKSGQTEAYSPEWTPSQTGIFYFRVIIKDENGKVLKYGAAREPSETIRIIDAKSKTTPVVDEQDSVPDKVTITGPVAAGTMVSWQIKRISDGGADYDEVMQSWNTPKDGAVIITDEQAKEALENGGITVESPRRFQGKAGEDYYFEFSLTSPKRAEDGTPAKAVKDKNGVYTTEHLESNGVLPIGEEKVDGDETEPQTSPTPFYTDRSRVDDETMRFIKITTTANTHNATVGDKIHDTAHITGHVTEGYCVKFEYWQQNDGDAGNDKLLTTTDCVTVPAGATSVDSPEITADKEGTFYWREQLIPVKPEQPTGPVTYGKPRVAGETVRVHPLAKTGIGVLPLIGGILILMGAGLALTLGGRRRRTNRGRHMA